MKSISQRIIKSLPVHTARLTHDCWPKDMPKDLPIDMRGLFLLNHYGPANMRDAINQVLQEEASCGGMGIGPEFLGFIEDYYRLAQYVSKFDVRTVIVDVGCCTGLQQVFFSEFAGYIGIDMQLPESAKPLQANARFIKGEFAQLVKSGEFVIEDNMFGIANMSILYTADPAPALAAFKKFKRMLLA